jgi:hypothetical protein
MKRILLVILFILSLAVSTHAANVYIDPDCPTPGNGSTGTCNNDGNDPLATSYGISWNASNDYYWKCDTVDEVDYLIVTSIDGTDPNRVVMGAYYIATGSEVIGVSGAKPIIRNNGIDDVLFALNTSDYWTIENLQFEKGHRTMFISDGSDNIIIRNNVIGAGSAFEGLFTRGDNGEIYGNVIDPEILTYGQKPGCYAQYGTPGPYEVLNDGLGLNYADGNIIYDNEINDWGHSNIGLSYSSNNLIYKNKVDGANTLYTRGFAINLSGTGNKIYFNHFSNMPVRSQISAAQNEVMYNLFDKTRDGTSGLAGSDCYYDVAGSPIHLTIGGYSKHTDPASDETFENKIYNNVFYDSVATTFAPITMYNNPGDHNVYDNEIYNNIIHTFATYGIYIATNVNGILDNVFRNNSIYASGLTNTIYYRGSAMSVITWNISQSNGDFVEANRYLNPRFGNPASGDFTIRMSSDAAYNGINEGDEATSLGIGSSFASVPFSLTEVEQPGVWSIGVFQPYEDACDEIAIGRSDWNTKIANATAGKVICLANGAYDDFSSQAGDRVVVPNLNLNNEEDRVVLKPVSMGGVVFTGTYNMNIASDYITVMGFLWIGNESYAPLAITAKLIDIQQGSYEHVKILNNYFKDFADGQTASQSFAIRFETGNDDIEIGLNVFDTFWQKVILGQCGGGCDRYRIWRNWFKDGSNITPSMSVVEIGKNGDPPIDMQGIYERNIFEDCPVDGETISDKAGGTIHRYNYFTGSQSITYRAGHDHKSYGNYFFNGDPSGAAFRIFGEDNLLYNNYIEGYIVGFNIASGSANHYLTPNRTKLYNNTVIQNTNGEGFAIGTDWSCSGDPPCDDPEDLDIKNNIVEITHASGYGVICFNWTTPTNADNLLNAEAGIAWNPDSGCGGMPAGYSLLDPLLTQGSYIWRLQASSVEAIDQGTVVSEVVVDIDNEARDATPDIGADEYNTPVVAMPLQENEVGITWSFQFYISQSGSDSNDGLTINTPWKTVCKINDYAESPGFPDNTIIHFKDDDVWDGTDGCNEVIGHDGVPNSGNWVNWGTITTLTFSNYGSGTNLPHLDNDHAQGFALNGVGNVTNIFIKNLNISGMVKTYAAFPSGYSDTGNIAAWSGTNMTIDNVYCDQWNGDPTPADESRWGAPCFLVTNFAGDVVVQNSYVQHVMLSELGEQASKGYSQDGTAISVGYRVNDTWNTTGSLKILNNECYDVESDCYQGRGYTNVEVADNTFKRYGENALDFKTFKNVMIHNNTFSRDNYAVGGSGPSSTPVDITWHQLGGDCLFNGDPSDDGNPPCSSPSYNLDNIQIYENKFLGPTTTNPNTTCRASGSPWVCCTGAGTGTCDTVYISYLAASGLAGHNIVIRDNYVKDMSGAFLIQSGDSQVVFRNKIVLTDANAWCGIATDARCSAILIGQYATNVLVAGNVIYANDGKTPYGIYAKGYDDVGGDVIKNNIVVVDEGDPTVWPLHDGDQTDALATVSHNIFYNPSHANRASWDGVTYSSSQLAAWVIAGHGVNQFVDTFGDPLFEDEVNDKFWVKTGSKAIDNGDNTLSSLLNELWRFNATNPPGTPELDFQTNHGIGWEIGLYLFEAGAEGTERNFNEGVSSGGTSIN